jgi:hypothetical protein
MQSLIPASNKILLLQISQNNPDMPLRISFRLQRRAHILHPFHRPCLVDKPMKQVVSNNANTETTKVHGRHLRAAETLAFHIEMRHLHPRPVVSPPVSSDDNRLRPLSICLIGMDFPGVLMLLPSTNNALIVLF